MTEKHIQIIAKLYDARDFTRRMQTPEEYKKNMTIYQGYIQAAMTKWNLDSLPATFRLAGKLDSPIVQAALFAAYIEMIEKPAG